MSSMSCQRVEVTQEMLKGLKIGDVVTMEITGTVKKMEIGPDAGLKDENERKGLWESPSCVWIDVANRDVSAAEGNEFEALAKEENDDAEDQMKRYAKNSGNLGTPAVAYDGD